MYVSVIIFDKKNKQDVIEKINILQKKDLENKFLLLRGKGVTPSLPTKTFHQKKTYAIKEQHQVPLKLLELYKKTQSKNVALATHKTSSIYGNKTVDLFVIDNHGNVKIQHQYNPLWRGLTPPKRRITSIFDTNNSLATQSLFFAMLDNYDFDEKMLSQMSLRDKQAETLYLWEKNEFESIPSLKLEQILKLMRRVLSYTHLPAIKTHFKNSGKQCSFSVSPKIFNADNIDKSKNWITTPHTEDEFYQTFDQKRNLIITHDSLSLNFVVGWGTRPDIIIHELSHYIAFMLPSPYLLNQGEITLTINEYTDIFAGHGVLYTSVFAHLLCRFLKTNKTYLHQSLTDMGLCFFDLEKFSLIEINQNIKKYILENRK